MICWDIETKSYADLKKVGAWVYSEDATTEIICAAWGIGHGEIQTWWPGKYKTDDMPDDLFYALIEQGQPFEAHNVSFEYSHYINVFHKRYGWPLPREDQWRDTMASACYLAMPAKLDQLARALGFPGKDREGTRLIAKYSKLYNKNASKIIPPEDFQKFVDYCVHDVKLEQAVSDALGDLPPHELELFHLDREINMRGLYLDGEGIAAASLIVDQRAEELTEKFRKITSPDGNPKNGFGPAQHAKVLTWFQMQGLKVDNLQAETIEELLEDGELGQGAVRTALEIRMAVNKASTKKLDSMARARSQDGRARFQTRFHGAQTGRNTGQQLQPLNMNRGFDPDLKITPEMLVRDIMHGDAEWLDMVYGDATDAIAKASRHWITAAPGNKLLSGDFVSIEAVILSCAAGEQWKIDAFADGKGIYELMACKIHNLPSTLADDKKAFKAKYPAERQDGKTGELAFGYQGALGAWLNFDSSGRHTDERIIEICKAWRAEHPMIVKFWRELEREAIAAVRSPGTATGYRQIGFEVVDDWLSMILPDGKRIWYREPELRVKMPNWHKPLTQEKCREGTCDCRPGPQLTYMALKFGAWRRVSTYGGKLTENAIQATSRQLLMPSVVNARRYKYWPILTVYDEVVVEVEKNFGSVDDFKEVILEPLDKLEWARGWPVSVDAWEGSRYRK